MDRERNGREHGGFARTDAMIKHTLVERLLADLRREIDVLLAAARATHEGATHEENRAENDKDTRAIEAGYLAGAQAARVADLRATADAVSSMPVRVFTADEPVSLSALVAVEIDGARAWFLIVPAGGGGRYEVEERSVQLITPRSPVGSALLGHTVGEAVEVQTQHALRTYEIVGVE